MSDSKKTKKTTEPAPKVKKIKEETKLAEETVSTQKVAPKKTSKASQSDAKPEVNNVKDDNSSKKQVKTPV